MLDMGFHDDLMKIVNALPKKRQTLLFSATMPGKIRQLAKKMLNDPKQLNIAMSKPVDGVLQGAYLVFEDQKINLIEKLLSGKKNYPSILIFASTKKKVRELNQRLLRKNFASAEISSDLDQDQREAALRKFKSKTTQILVATDILARGIDIKEISLVINYEVPQDAEDYVHRIGRTARADATGVALTLISENDQYRFKQIEELIGSEVMIIPNPPEIGEGPKYNPNQKPPRGNFRGHRRKSGRKPFRRNQR